MNVNEKPGLKSTLAYLPFWRLKLSNVISKLTIIVKLWCNVLMLCSIRILIDTICLQRWCRQQAKISKRSVDCSYDCSLWAKKLVATINRQAIRKISRHTTPLCRFFADQLRVHRRTLTGPSPYLRRTFAGLRLFYPYSNLIVSLYQFPIYMKMIWRKNKVRILKQHPNIGE